MRTHHIILLSILFALASLGFTMTPADPTLTIEPGGITNTTLSLTTNNTSPIEISQFTRNDTVGSVLVQYAPTTLTITNTTPGTVTAHFSVPSTMTPGTYEIILQAQSNTTQTRTAPITLDVEDDTPTGPEGFSLSVSQIMLGHEDQRRGEIVSGTFNVINNRDEPVNTLTLTHTVPTRYRFNITSQPASLGPHEQGTVSYHAYIPRNQDSRETSAGQLSYNADGITGQIPVRAQARSELDISRVDFDSDKGSDSNLAEGSVIRRDLTPGDDASFTVRVDNTFDASADEIRDVEVTITIEGIDDRDDLEVYEEIHRIRGRSFERFTLDFTVPARADQGEFRVLIETFGIDRDGASHEDRFETWLNIRRERNDLRIERLEITPQLVCEGDSFTTRVDVRNEGTRDQSAARVDVQLMGRDVSRSEVFSIDRYTRTNNRHTATFSIPTTNIAPGTYTVRALVYHEGENLNDIREGRITIDTCAPTPTPPDEDPTDDTPVIIIEPTEPVTPEPPEERESGWFIALLIFANLLAVLLIIGVAAKLLAK